MSDENSKWRSPNGSPISKKGNTGYGYAGQNFEVPKGWKLVPLDLTPEMAMAGQVVPIQEDSFVADFRTCGSSIHTIYSVLLSSAPQPPTMQGE